MLNSPSVEEKVIRYCVYELVLTIQHVRKSGDCDVDNMVTSLQATYPEYSRRKRHAFQNLVGKLLWSLDSSNQFSKDCHVDEKLVETERQHFEKRMREAQEEELYVIMLYGGSQKLD